MAPLVVSSACGSIGGLSDDAVRYHAEVEQTQDHIVLPNIVRASMNRPLHFTTFAVLRGHRATVPAA